MAWLRALADEARAASRTGARGLVRPAAVLASAVLVGVAAQPPAAGAGAGGGAGVGEPCRAVHRAPVRLASNPAGGVEAVFSLAGGSLRGAVPLSAREASELGARRDVYVTDVQLGTYEPAAPGAAAVCRLDPTYHFLCEATGALDQLCFEWTVVRITAQPSPVSDGTRPCSATLASQASTSRIRSGAIPHSPRSRDSTAPRIVISGTA